MSKNLAGFPHFLSGTRDHRFIPENAGILFNIIDNFRTERMMEKTRDFIDKSLGRKIFLDSSGYHLLNAENKGKEITFDYSRDIVSGKRAFNLTTDHIIELREKLGETLSTNLDWPVKKTNDPSEQKADFKKKFDFNIKSAVRTAQITAEKQLPGSLFLGIQAYNVSQVDRFLNSFKDLTFDGVCLPVRTMTTRQIAAFVFRIRQVGIKAVHILGTGSLANLAMCAFLARNVVDYISVDGTGWLFATSDEKIMDPVTLRRIKVGKNDTGPFLKDCGCRICRGKNPYDRPVTPWESRAIHNCHAVCHACEELYRYATDIELLTNHLKNPAFEWSERTVDMAIKGVSGILAFKDAETKDLERYLI